MIDTLAWMVVAATLVSAHRAAAAHSRQQLEALVALELVAVAMIVLAAVNEPAWASLAQEDGPVEWATFASFLTAAGVLLFTVRKRGTSPWFFGACGLLALFCLGVAGEEISWGQRLLGFKPPDVFLERNFQQELNLHNVLMHEGGLGFKLESKHLVMAIALGFALLWPLLVRRGRFRQLAALAPPLTLLPIALGIVAAELSYPVDLTGEGAELMCGLMFLAAAVLAAEPAPSRVATWIAAPLAAGLLLSVVMAKLVFGSDAAGVATARTELLQLRTDLTSGAVRPKLAARNIHKRLFTAARDGYLRFAGGVFLEGRGTPAEASRPAGTTPAPAAREDRHGYFLDPWNNPYWIAFDRRTRSGTVYSFGPNRRRDLNVRDPQGDPGDDVLLRFQLEEAPDAPAAPTASPGPSLPGEPEPTPDQRPLPAGSSAPDGDPSR